ncbi:MAG: DHHA1 domain-containing protein, partial [Candidatus Saliniplasma sp.]
YHYVDNLIGEVYTFPDEEIGTMLHEAKEFSTLLNSCGRYNKGDVGLQVCLGDRGEYLKKAEQLLKGHQKVLVECMNYVESAGGVKERDLIQYFHGKDEIPDTVLGTVAGMILGSGDVDRELVMIAFANSSEREGLKVSSRGTKRLVDRGLDLSEIMSIVSDEFGGEGGGHDIAAGAYIPQGVEEDFLDRVEKMIKKQLD